MEKLGISEKDPSVTKGDTKNCPVCGTDYKSTMRNCPFCSRPTAQALPRSPEK